MGGCPKVSIIDVTTKGRQYAFLRLNMVTVLVVLLLPIGHLLNRLNMSAMKMHSCSTYLVSAFFPQNNQVKI